MREYKSLWASLDEWRSIGDIRKERADSLGIWYPDMTSGKTITLTPDQYSIVDEPKMIPEICEKTSDKP